MLRTNPYRIGRAPTLPARPGAINQWLMSSGTDKDSGRRPRPTPPKTLAAGLVFCCSFQVVAPWPGGTCVAGLAQMSVLEKALARLGAAAPQKTLVHMLQCAGEFY